MSDSEDAWRALLIELSYCKQEKKRRIVNGKFMLFDGVVKKKIKNRWVVASLL